MLNFILRIIVLLCIFIRWIYWKRSEVVADKEKPKRERTVLSYASQTVWWGVISIPLIQICGVHILEFKSLNAQIVGVVIVILGTVISLWSRYTLAANWANGYEYQIKEDQELVTRGVYSVIRHPIYLGLILVAIGIELVAQSYLWISYLAFFIAFYFQGRREEKILLNHFGDKYKEYMKHTKMLIPFIL